jgi:hypothetical protein
MAPGNKLRDWLVPPVVVPILLFVVVVVSVLLR